MSEVSRNHSSSQGVLRVPAMKHGKSPRRLERSRRSIQSIGEAGSVYFADYAHLVQFFSVAVEEQDGGWAEQLVAIQQATLGSIALGDVEAD